MKQILTAEEYAELHVQTEKTALQFGIAQAIIVNQDYASHVQIQLKILMKQILTAEEIFALHVQMGKTAHLIQIAQATTVKITLV